MATQLLDNQKNFVLHTVVTADLLSLSADKLLKFTTVTNLNVLASISHNFPPGYYTNF